MVDAIFVKKAECRPGGLTEFDAKCGVCVSELGRRASFPVGFTSDHISCHECGALNKVRRPRGVA